MRPNSEGTLCKATVHGRPKWRVAISVGNGKRTSRYFDTQNEAVKFLQAANLRKARGMKIADSDQKLAKFLEEWLSQVKNTLRPSTYHSYEQICRNHLTPALGDVPLSKLTPAKLTAFFKGIHETGISAEHARRVLRAALNHAIRHELVVRNAASLATCPKKPLNPPKFLTVDEARSFLSAVKGHRHEALFTVALACGLRFAEALGLAWQDVDLEKGTLTVRRQLRSVKGQGRQFSEPKSKAGIRAVPIPAFAVEALKEHRLRQEFQDRIAAGSRWKESGLVFTSTIGTPCEERNVRRSLALILEANGLPKIRFHDLRHSCATLLLAQGVDPRTIMQILGHSQITLTLNTYAHVLPSLTQDAAERMNRLLGNG